MSMWELLDTVQPAEGWFAVVGINESGVVQRLVETRAEVEEAAERFARNGRNVFFGVAKFITGDSRKRDNVHALRALWVDLDCGPKKAAVNPKTKRPDGYLTQQDALTALRDFCTTSGLPLPTVVDSGGGIHAYWPLQQDVPREEWEVAAAALRAKCEEAELWVDRSVFEAARILRVPGTLNHKFDPPRPVRLLRKGKPTDISVIKSVLNVQAVPLPASNRRPMSALQQSLVESFPKSFAQIMRRSASGNGCAQLLGCYTDRASLGENRWFDALSVAKFCEDGERAALKLSSEHPDYDPAKVVAKMQHIAGPHTCDTFERNNPGGCAGCPFQGKIKSPIVLGKLIPEAQEDEIEVEPDDEGVAHNYKIPEYPWPFYRAEGGGIAKKPIGDEGEPILVYEHDLYVVNRMRDPVLGDVVVLRFHTPKDGVREFTIANAKIADPGEMRKVLAAEGVVLGKKRFDMLVDFVIASIREHQMRKRAELMRMQFGWADNDTKFIIGDQEVAADGAYYSPPSSVTKQLVPFMGPVGTFDKWREVFDLYSRPGLEPHAFAAATAFGAPLLKFLGQKGAIINVIHPRSGTGKTTILHMCNSVYGSPDNLCTTQKDTANARILRLGVMNNLPFTIDEITNMEAREFSDLAYSMSQGRGKDRVKASSNELRENLTSWQTVSLCSSNASFYEKLATFKSTPDGEMMRLFEYRIDHTDTLDPAVAKQMFDHQLLNNYGHAGPMYMRYVLRNLTDVKNTLASVQAKIDRELRLTPRERFWSALVAANITGAMIANINDIASFDHKRLYLWATKAIEEMRVDHTPPANDTMSVVGDFINRNINNALVIKSTVDKRSKGLVNPPLVEPRGELLLRFEPDTGVLMVVARAFREFCVSRQTNYSETVRDLTSKGVMIGADTKHIGKGMKLAAGPVHCLMFDTTHSDFIDMDAVVASAGESDAD